MHIAAICFNERELEIYVSQLRSQGFESLSEAKKAEDGSYYQVLARTSKFEIPAPGRASFEPAESIPA